MSFFSFIGKLLLLLFIFICGSIITCGGNAFISTFIDGGKLVIFWFFECLVVFSWGIYWIFFNGNKVALERVKFLSIFFLIMGILSIAFGNLGF